MVRNPKYATPDGASIDVELNHADFGWIPFTATPDDVEQHGRDIYAAVIAGEYGPISPYESPPPTEPVTPQAVTRRQGRLALLEVGKLDDVEAAVESAGMAAQIEYETDTWERSNAFLQSMWAQLGGTESELDALFILASGK